MKQVLLPILGAVLFILVVGLITQKLGRTPFSNKKEVKIGDLKILVLLADSQEKRKRGLSKVESLAENEGVLFVFEEKDVVPGFWMKDMLIPIDIIWINDGKIVKIDKNIAPGAPETPDSELKLYYPGQPIDYVLEVNAGFSSKNNIKTVDPVSIKN